MIGPIFRQELLLGGRRNRLHLFRWFYAGWLIVLVFFYAMRFVGEEHQRVSASARNGEVIASNSLSSPLVIGRWFADSFLWNQTLLLLLATPPLVAGAVTDEKRSGTLQYLLTSELDSRQIVLGKMLGRVAQVCFLLLAGLPLFGLLAGFGGIGPAAALLTFAATLPPLLGVAAAAVFASVLCRQTRDAVLALYAVGIAAWVGLHLGGWDVLFEPRYVVEPAWGQRGLTGVEESLRRLLVEAGAWLGLGAVCLGLAVWRLRPTFTRELEGYRPQGVRWYSVEREPVDDEPVRWRERNVEGLAPTPSLRRVPQWLGITLVAVATTCSSLLILYSALPAGATLGDVLKAALRLDLVKLRNLMPGADLGFLLQSLVVLLLASLTVGVRCSGAITGERERQTWEALLMTPLPAPQIVQGKLWGVVGASYWYLLAYAAPAVTLSIFGGLLSFLWTVLWLGATILAMYFIGAVGLWCSVRSRDSWRSLFGTLLVGYVGGSVLYCATMPVLMLLALILQLFLIGIDRLIGTQMAKVVARGLTNSNYVTLVIVVSSAGLALLCYLLARLFLNWTARWIADRERTRHWQEERYYRRSRRSSLPPLRRY